MENEMRDKCIHEPVCAHPDCIPQGCPYYVPQKQEEKELTGITSELLSTPEPCEVFQLKEQTVFDVIAHDKKQLVYGTSIAFYHQLGAAIIKRHGAPVAFVLPNCIILANEATV